MKQDVRFKLVFTNNTFVKADSVYMYALAIAADLLLPLGQFLEFTGA